MSENSSETDQIMFRGKWTIKVFPKQILCFILKFIFRQLQVIFVIDIQEGWNGVT